MDETQIDDIPQVSVEENNFLTAEYSEEEVRKAIFQMEYNKTPGPDGFPVDFYQTFWDTIKGDLLDLFSCLHAGQLELFCLNFGEMFCYLKLIRQKGSSNTDQSVFLMLDSRFSQKWPP
jgi:hypothetical protein